MGYEVYNFQEIIDIKYLTDIPELAVGIAHGLPRYQITARDVRTGMLWIAYAFERNSTVTALFVHRLLTHLEQCGVDVSKIMIQDRQWERVHYLV